MAFPTIDATSTLVNAGAAFNDAVSLVEGGLTATTQPQFATDMYNVEAGIDEALANINSPIGNNTSINYNGTDNILTPQDIAALQAAEAQATTIPQTFSTLPLTGSAEASVVAGLTDLANIIDGDPALAAMLAQHPTATGAVGFQSPPPLPPPVVTEALKNDTGSSSTDHITNDPTLTGSGDPNAVVHFTLDGMRLRQRLPLTTVAIGPFCRLASPMVSTR
jgi:hypothetical protein